MSWITKNIFQMSWLNDFFNWIIFDLFGINSTSKFAHSVNYFLFDTTKIFILMSVLIFLMGVLQSFFPPEKTKNLLHKVNGVTGNILGAFLGAITPFCSCSSIPIFIGFTSSGLPLGVTFSFLFASPRIDIASVILLASFMGMKIAISYIFVGLLMSIIGGIIIKHLHMENQIADYVKNIQSTEVSIAALTLKNRI